MNMDAVDPTAWDVRILISWVMDGLDVKSRYIISRGGLNNGI